MKRHSEPGLTAVVASAMTAVVLVGVPAFSLDVPAPPEPFGVRFGALIDEAFLHANGCQGSGPNLYVCRTLPKPLAKADVAYALLLDPPGYPVRVLAAVTFEADACGVEVGAATGTYGTLLRAKYGPPSHDLVWLRPGSIWTGPCDYAMALKVGDRIRTLAWERLDDQPYSALLRQTASSGSTTVLTLLYEDSVRSAAIEARKATSDSEAL